MNAKRWKTAGIAATLVILLVPPLELLRERVFPPTPARSPRGAPATFVGHRKCAECHKREYDQWRGSDHDRAMAPADEKTVLGDFNDAVFEAFGVTSRFYRKDGRFFVHTQGPGGRMGEFEVTYTFGCYPLQQYLVPFPGGRLQCLPLAWDVKKKRWYHLYPDEPLDPKDWLYWTNAGQNWNGMCAECHSTNIHKGYDVATDTYHTTWSEIDVGCEACHGPGSRHVRWAETPEMARPERVENYDLVVKISGISARRLVEQCAPCHSRRSSLGDYRPEDRDLLDSVLPRLLEQDLYFPDGQILGEVYVYGSFTQSKMYHRDVRCSDCHDVHSLKRVKEGNALCLQCHRAAVYDTKAHHFHKKKGEKGEPIRFRDGKILFEVGSGAECVQCHMPGRVYMGIDYRADHSLRIPRPDLTIRLGTPNACNRCHADKTAEWADRAITKWYGPGRGAHYGTILAAGREGRKEAQEELIRLAGDPLYPVIVRATALSLLVGYPPGPSAAVFEAALGDVEALIRRTAVALLRLPDPNRQIDRLTAMLYDPVKAVRMEAARRIAEAPSRDRLDEHERRAYQAALAEFKAAMEYSGDFAASRYNLGNLYFHLGDLEKAAEAYRAAIRIDDAFYPAKVNLAMLENQRGNQDRTEALLREVLEAHPELAEVHYSLGLLLAERKRYREAARHLEKAAEGLPDRARVHYNLGQLLAYLHRDQAAEAHLGRALALEPENMDFLSALAEFYLARGRWGEAEKIARRMIAAHPSEALGHELLRALERGRRRGGKGKAAGPGTGG